MRRRRAVEEPIDERVLHKVEADARTIAMQVHSSCASIAPALDLRFWILFAQSDGPGSSWIRHPGTTTEDFIASIRAQGERLAAETESPSVTYMLGEGGFQHALAIRLQADLGRIGEIAKMVLPRGWLFAIYVYHENGPGHVYLSSAERHSGKGEGMAECLIECADRTEAGEALPPGSKHS